MVDYYLGLLAAREHVLGFERAIRATVSADDVVVDLGCGIGTYSIFAARAGARRVFGVDSSPAIEHAREMARRNNVEVEFIAGHSNDIELPEKATVLIFEDYSTDLLSGPVPRALESVRARWLADDCRVLPERVSVHACPLGSSKVSRAVNPFAGDEESSFGIDCSTLLEAARNTAFYCHDLDDATLLSASDTLLEHTTSSPIPRAYQGSGNLPFTRNGDMVGLCIWHDLNFSQSDAYSNRPGGSAIWGQLVLPTPQAWPVTSGMRLRYKIAYHAMFESGFWKWSYELVDEDGETLRKCSGDTFAGSPLRAGSAGLYTADDAIGLTEPARIEARVLALADGARTISEIAGALQEELGLADPATALEHVHRSLQGRRTSR